MFQEHVVSYSCTWHQGYSSFNQARLLPYNSFPEVWGANMESPDISGIWAQSSEKMKVELMRSKIDHQKPGMACSVRMNSGREMVIGYHSCKIIYAKLYDDGFGKEVLYARISVSLNKIQRYFLQIRYYVKDSDAKSHQIWGVSARLKPLLFIDDVQWLEDGRIWWIVQNSNGRRT